MTNKNTVYMSSKDRREINLEIIVWSIFISNRSVLEKHKILEKQLTSFSNEIDKEISKEREFYSSNKKDYLNGKQHMSTAGYEGLTGLSSLAWYVSLYKSNMNMSKRRIENLIKEKEEIKDIIFYLKGMIK